MDNTYGMYGIKGTNPLANGIMQAGGVGGVSGMPMMPQGMPMQPIQMDMYGQQQNGIHAALMAALRGQNGTA